MTDATSSTDVRTRVLGLLEDVQGFAPDPAQDELTGLDSLQVLELLVSLEEEFNIDSDLIIAARPDWWSSVSTLVDAVTAQKQGSGDH